MLLSVSKWNALSLCLGLFGSLLLVGCSGSFAPGPVTPEKTAIGTIQGKVHGGNFPISGAQLYLFAASTSGYGTNATSLMTSSANGVSCTNPAVSGACYVTTDANGDFEVGGDYACTEGQQVYMVAVGGNPGLATNFATTATFANNSSTITVASATGISVGATISGSGVGGTVTAVSGTTVTLSQKTTAAGMNVSVTFTLAVNNTGIVQMAALGQCPAAGNLAAQVPYLVINEVTTVAFAYSVGGFATTAYNVSTDSTGTTALANAFANANNIVVLGNGTAPAVTNGNPNSTNPQAKIYALANILATCVNTTSSASSQCTSLFKYATTSSGTKATDESNAIFNIAHNQGQNVASLWNLTPTTPVFSQTLKTEPTDWTLPVIYTGVLSSWGTSNNQVTSGAYNIAFDGSGNAWIGDRLKGVIEMTPQGAVSTYNPGFGMVKGVAVSPDSTQIWVTDYANNQVYIMTSAGAISTTLPTTAQVNAGDNELYGPSALAFDAAGNAFVVNETNGSIIAYSSTGGYLNYSGAMGVNTPAWIAVDGNNNAWIPSTNSAEVGQLEFTYTGNSGKVKFKTETSITADDSYGVAIDSNNNGWFGTDYINGGGAPSGESLEEIVRTGTTNKNGKTTYTYSVNASYTGQGSTGGGLGLPYKITVDGGNNVWLANEYYSTISEYSQSLSAWLGVPGTSPSGYSNGTTSAGTLSATPDNSGNLWTANTDGSVTQLLGLATPTANPIYPGVFGTQP